MSHSSWSSDGTKADGKVLNVSFGGCYVNTPLDGVAVGDRGTLTIEACHGTIGAEVLRVNSSNRSKKPIGISLRFHGIADGGEREQKKSPSGGLTFAVHIPAETAKCPRGLETSPMVCHRGIQGIIQHQGFPCFQPQLASTGGVLGGVFLVNGADDC